VVVDTQKDERFADNPLVTAEPHIRFYAGRPLRVNGHAIGTLCLIDQQPRTLSEIEIAQLDDLASIAESELSLVELEKVQQKLKAEIQHRVAAQEKAEQANNLKDEFLANMSHEIRTPMNAIVGLGDLLAESRLSARQREYLTAMQTCSASLLKLLNDILDLSKIEAQKLSLTNKPFLCKLV